jgi:hypothetical protein
MGSQQRASTLKRARAGRGGNFQGATNNLSKSAPSQGPENGKAGKVEKLKDPHKPEKACVFSLRDSYEDSWQIDPAKLERLKKEVPTG